MTALRLRHLSLLFPGIVGCATGTEPSAVPAPLELEPEAPPSTSSLAQRTAPTSPNGETHQSQPSAFTPCTEDNPSGCKAPTVRPIKLDPSHRYPVNVRADDPSVGPATAPVVAVVFSDFQCPFCARLEPVLDELRARFPKELRIVWKDLPLSIHEFAQPAALLAREAYVKYGTERFWHVHDELFHHQALFSNAWFASFARGEQLSWPASEIFLPRVEQNVQQADELAIGATPTVFINGRPVIGAEHISVYADVINEELGN